MEVRILFCLCAKNCRKGFSLLCGHPVWLSCVIWVVMWGMWCICTRGGGGVSLGEVSGWDRQRYTSIFQVVRSAARDSKRCRFLVQLADLVKLALHAGNEIIKFSTQNPRQSCVRTNYGCHRESTRRPCNCYTVTVLVPSEAGNACSVYSLHYLPELPVHVCTQRTVCSQRTFTAQPPTPRVPC